MVDYLKKQDDIVHALRTVFVHNIWDFIPMTYQKTRDFEGGLALAEYLTNEITLQRKRISKEEFERWDSELVYFKLNMLESLNRWKDYIEYFELCRHQKNYNTPYGSVGEPTDEYHDYITHSDKEFHYVHFLFQQSGQYESVKKKFDKWRSGKKVGNLMRHQQDRLSDEEIQQKLQFITGLLDNELARLKRYGVPQNHMKMKSGN
ncbi:MAG: hypothetical protein LBV27_09550 [Oscillospiraceae bacterium]|jgi:hypothetical protein|nr:hypothetical protein [Oscillospiraceae bacterium]